LGTEKDEWDKTGRSIDETLRPTIRNDTPDLEGWATANRKAGSDPGGLEVLVGAILMHLGLSGEHFDETPRRVAAFLQSFRQEHDLAAILKTGFAETKDNILVVQKDIPFKGLCAHHLVPFWGTAAVGYIPRKRIVGLSKLSRLVLAAGELSPSTQEDITNLVVDTLFDTLEPLGAGIVTTAAHGCMAVRGVHAPGTTTRVSALRGQLLLNPQARSEFLEMIR
jgi:GTP cyclohydrolase I